MGAISSSSSSVEEDSKYLKKLLAAAKFGRWNEVLGILGTPENPKRAYLINCIPEDRRWGVLHQAAYFNNQNTIKTLLRFATCDTSVKTKDGSCEKGPHGASTPYDIATQFGHTNIANVLMNNACKPWNQELPTYHTLGTAIEQEDLGLFRITLAAYKDAFFPFHIERSKTITTLMNDIFVHVDSRENWKLVRDRICQSLFSVCEDATKKLEAAKTKAEFYSAVVNGYTFEETRLYDTLNTALRRQRKTGYQPTADDLAVGPYTLMYNLILLFWNQLKRESVTTYRKMKVTEINAKKYQKGVKFTWLAFVSSSTNYANAVPFPTVVPSGEKSIIFICDNSTESRWQPRNIEEYAAYHEHERVYPAGAEFIVQNREVKDGITKVWLKLERK